MNCDRTLSYGYSNLTTAEKSIEIHMKEEPRLTLGALLVY
jgi:hypothetical protein